MNQMVEPHITVRGEFCIETRPEASGIIIFGASGDLTGRKLIPALLNLFRRGPLPKRFYVLGAARTPMSDDQFRERLLDDLFRYLKDVNREQAHDFLTHCYYEAGQYDDPDFYRRIQSRMNHLDAHYETVGQHVFYLATPPNLYAPVVQELGRAGMVSHEASGWNRVVIEKPFGRDLRSALELDAQLHEVLAEDQLYRIDHYLGKETVQNILMFRFANSIFEPVWNRNYISHVTITVAESIGVGHRAGYFEQAGIMRDMFQNHMMQMLSLVAMEPPASFHDERVRDEKVKLLRSIRPFALDQLDEQIVRGQYEAGSLDGQHLPAYREEPGVAPDSMVETFVAARLMVDNWRWQGVPFYLRSGKRLKRRVSQIAIHFRHVPHSMFSPLQPQDLQPNLLVFNVQPDEGIALRMQAKQPGPKLCMSSLNMAFKYADVFPDETGDAYERLLLDAMLGDQTLFVRSDDMRVAWSLITPVLEKWEQQGQDGAIFPYAPGSWGPIETDVLTRRDGNRWLNPEPAG